MFMFLHVLVALGHCCGAIMFGTISFNGRSSTAASSAVSNEHCLMALRTHKTWQRRQLCLDVIWFISTQHKHTAAGKHAYAYVALLFGSAIASLGVSAYQHTSCGDVSSSSTCCLSCDFFTGQACGTNSIMHTVACIGCLCSLAESVAVRWMLDCSL